MTDTTPPAPLGEGALPLGCITKTRNGQRWFYPHGESPYLDNAVECVTVYAEAQLSTLRDQVARLERERDAAVSAHTAVQRAGFHFREAALSLRQERSRLRAGLEDVCTVLETNTTAIVDTVWVSTGAPETLLDHCRSLLDAPALKAAPLDVEHAMEMAREYAEATYYECRFGGQGYGEARDAAREALRAALTAKE